MVVASVCDAFQGDLFIGPAVSATAAPRVTGKGAAGRHSQELREVSATCDGMSRRHYYETWTKQRRGEITAAWSYMDSVVTEMSRLIRPGACDGKSTWRVNRTMVLHGLRGHGKG